MTEPSTSSQLMRQRRFWPLFWAQFLGAFNDQVYKNAFVALLVFRISYEQSYTSEQVSLYISLASGLYVLPFFLIAPTSGVLSDRIDKARMMRWVKLAEIIIMCGAVFAYSSQNVFLLFVVLVLMGTQSAVFSPVKYGILPQYLPKHDLITGNGLVQAGTFLAILLGTIVGTQIILTTYGVFATCILVVLLAVLGYLASLFALPAPPATHLDTSASPRLTWNIASTINTLIRDVAKIPLIFKLILASGWFWFMGATYLTLLPLYVKDVLQVSENIMTVLLAAFSIGVALGAMLCARLTKGKITTKFVPLSAIGMALFGIHLSFADIEPVFQQNSFFETVLGWRIFFDFVGLAMCSGLYITPLNTAMQHYAPINKTGQVIACSNVVDAVSMVVASALIIALQAYKISVPAIYGIVATTGFIIAGWLYFTRKTQDG